MDLDALDRAYIAARKATDGSTARHDVAYRARMDRDATLGDRVAADTVRCRQCGKPMNPVEVMLGPVCGKCVRDNHAKAVK